MATHNHRGPTACMPEHRECSASCHGHVEEVSCTTPRAPSSRQRENYIFSPEIFLGSLASLVFLRSPRCGCFCGTDKQALSPVPVSITTDFRFSPPPLTSECPVMMVFNTVGIAPLLCCEKRFGGDEIDSGAACGGRLPRGRRPVGRGDG